MNLSKIAIPDAFSSIRSASAGLGHSLVFVAAGSRIAGVVELAPTVRPEARRVVDELHRRGLRVSILSGDQEGPTRKLAKELNIKEFQANVLPQGKAELIRKLQERGEQVCFVGDGINDAIALKEARVSVSLRGATTVATDAAQIVLMDRTIDKLPLLFEMAHDLDRNLRASFLISAGGGYALMAAVILLHLPVAAGMFYSYLIGAGVLVNTMLPAVRRRKELLESAKKSKKQAAGCNSKPSVVLPI